MKDKKKCSHIPAQLLKLKDISENKSVLGIVNLPKEKVILNSNNKEIYIFNKDAKIDYSGLKIITSEILSDIRGNKTFNTGECVALLLSSLYKIGVLLGELDNKDTNQNYIKTSILNLIYKEYKKSSSEGATKILRAFKELNVSLDLFEEGLKKNLLRSVFNDCQSYNKPNVTSNLISINYLGLKWNELNESLQEKLLADILINCGSFSSEDLYIVLDAIKNLGLKWIDLNFTYDDLLRTYNEIDSLYIDTVDLRSGLLNSVLRICKSKLQNNIEDILITLDDMGLSWNEQDEKLQQCLFKICLNKCNKLESNKILAILNILHHFELKSNNINTELKAVFLNTDFLQKLNNVHSSYIVKTLKLISNLNLTWKNIDKNSQLNLLKNILKDCDDFNSQDISFILETLHNLKLQLNDMEDIDNIKKEFQLKLLIVISQFCKYFNSQDIVVVLDALNDFHIEWSNVRQIDFKLQAELLDAILKNCSNLDSKQIARVVNALHKLNLEWINISDTGYIDDIDVVKNKLQPELLKVILRECGNFLPQEISEILNSLSGMGVKWIDLEELLQESILDIVLAKSKNFNFEEICLVLNSLENIGFTWIDDSNKNFLSRNVIQKINQFKSENILATISALSFVGVTKDSLLKDTISTLLDAIFKYCDVMDSKNIVKTLIDLRYVGFMCHDFKEELQDKLLNFVLQSCDNFSSSDIANILNALKKMQLEWDELDKNLQSKLLSAVLRESHDFSSSEIAKVLKSIQGMGIKWDSLDQILKQKLLNIILRESQNFDFKDMCKTLIAMGKIRFAFQDNDASYKKIFEILLGRIKLDFLPSISTSSSSCAESKEDVFLLNSIASAVLYFYNTNNLKIDDVLHVEGQPKVKYSEFIEKSIKNSVTISKFQNKVLSFVKEVYKSAKGETYIEELFSSVDIFVKNKKLIIEVDGPQHYTSCGKLNNKTLTKEKLFQSLGYAVVHINVYTWFDIEHGNKKYLESLVNKALVEQAETKKNKLKVNKSNTKVQALEKPKNECDKSKTVIKTKSTNVNAKDLKESFNEKSFRLNPNAKLFEYKNFADLSKPSFNINTNNSIKELNQNTKERQSNLVDIKQKNEKNKKNKKINKIM